MKLNFGRKLLLFLQWLGALICLAITVIAFVDAQCIQKIAECVRGLMGNSGAQIFGYAIGILYLLLLAAVVFFLFPNSEKRKERGFITIDSNDAGRTRIAVSAVEQMIRQAMRGIEGISEMKSGITNYEDAISITVSVNIMSGTHIPTITMNTQRAIRSFIELNCGIAVREVSVSVHAVQSEQEDIKTARKHFAKQKNEIIAPLAPETDAAAMQRDEQAEAEDSISLKLDINEEKPAVEAAEDVLIQDEDEAGKIDASEQGE